MTADVLVLPKAVSEGKVAGGESSPEQRGLILTLDVAWRVSGNGGAFTMTVPVDMGLTWPQTQAAARTAVEQAVRAAAGVAIDQYRFQLV